MSAIANLLERTAAVGVIALGLCFAAAPARAETKNTTNWNASSFGAACNASPACISNKEGTKGEIMTPGGTVQVRCSSNSCSYTTPSGGGGSPARVAPPDKTLGTGVGLGGLLASQGSGHPKKIDVGQRVSGPDKIDTPKAVKIDTPKVSAPVGNVPKDVKVNSVR
jgi:hypothetical protein